MLMVEADVLSVCTSSTKPHSSGERSGAGAEAVDINHLLRALEVHQSAAHSRSIPNVSARAVVVYYFCEYLLSGGKSPERGGGQRAVLAVLFLGFILLTALS